MSDEIIGTVETIKEKKGIGKIASLIGQIIAAVWVASWSAAKFLNNLSEIDISDVCFSGLMIAGCFSPVYFSIIMDKIKEIKIGGQK